MLILVAGLFRFFWGSSLFVHLTRLATPTPKRSAVSLKVNPSLALIENAFLRKSNEYVIFSPFKFPLEGILTLSGVVILRSSNNPVEWVKTDYKGQDQMTLRKSRKRSSHTEPFLFMPWAFEGKELPKVRDPMSFKKWRKRFPFLISLKVWDVVLALLVFGGLLIVVRYLKG